MAGTFLKVASPVVDLRNEPDLTLPHDFSHQDGRETQLLFGERLVLFKEKGDWIRVGALEQLRYTQEEGWHPYPGWVRKAEVIEDETPFPTHVACSSGPYSYGTLISEAPQKIRPLPKIPSREQLVEEAHQFLDAPYLWGGRSSPLLGKIASVDCSGLVNLLYRAQGICLPRNAHDQYLISQPAAALLPGDPLYLSKDSRINHVILKLDGTTFIESPETGKKVRLLHWGQDIGEKEGKIWFFDRPALYTPYPRTFIGGSRRG